MDSTPGLPPLPPIEVVPQTTPTVPQPEAPQATPTRRRLPLGAVAGIIILLAAGIGYTLGRVHSNPVPSPTTPTTTNPAYAPHQNTPSAQVTEPVALNAPEVTVGSKTIVSGTIAELTPTGFTVRVTSRTINTSSGALGEQTKLYTVKLTPTTKLTLTTTTVTMPAGGGTPALTQTTKTIKPADLSSGQTVTVVSSTTGSTLTALEVRESVVVRK